MIDHCKIINPSVNENLLAFYLLDAIPAFSSGDEKQPDKSSEMRKLQKKKELGMSKLAFFRKRLVLIR